MVQLLPQSSIDKNTYPYLYTWDSTVRKHYYAYQGKIDAITYQLQRMQRYLFSFNYPFHNSAYLLRLKALKLKQSLGYITNHYLKLYEHIDPNIKSHFNKSFALSYPIPYTGLFVGIALNAALGLINSMMVIRISALIVPIVLDFMYCLRDPVHDSHSIDFFNWLVEYRKTVCFNERYQKKFQTKEAIQTFGERSMVDIGEQMLALVQYTK